MKTQALKNRALISLSGKDVEKFLQGVITNDIHALKEAELLYALMLTPQGRFLYDFFIHKIDEEFFIDHDGRYTSDIIKKLSMYKLRYDVSIDDLSDKYMVIAIEGDNNSLRRLFKDPRVSESDYLGYRGYIEKDSFKEVCDMCSLEESVFYYEAIYSNVLPEPHMDMIQEKSFPMEYSMDEFNAISFDKGCYLGQELTARTKHRGTIRKKLCLLDAKNTPNNISTLKLGDDLIVNDRKIGIFCSSHHKYTKALLRINDK